MWENLSILRLGNDCYSYNGLGQYAYSSVTGFEKWGVRPLRQGIAAMMGNGITVTDGSDWRHARKTLRPVFQKSQFEALEKKAFEKHLSRTVERINPGSTVDLQQLFRRMFINVSLEYIFGETRFSEFDGSSPEADTFIADYNTAFQIIVKMRQFGINIPFDILGHKRALKTAVKKLQPYVNKQITTALDKRQKALKGGKQAPDSDEGYVFVDQLVYETQDLDFVRDQLLNIWFPARDASSAGASFIFFILARNPHVWEKLRNKVVSMNNPLTSPYLGHVINECLRLLAPNNNAHRVCLKDCVLPYGGGTDGLSPIYVSAGTIIELNFGQLHKDKGIWGEDALEFRPERWESLDSKVKYQPFYAGPRRCPAQQMLLSQYGYLLVRMVTMFERIESRDDSLELVEEHSITMSSRNGVQVALFPAAIL